MAASEGVPVSGVFAFLPDSSWFQGVVQVKGSSDKFGVVGVEYSNQCPCMMDKDGSVDQVRCAVQLASTGGLRWRCDVVRTGGTMAALAGDLAFTPEAAFTDKEGADIICRVMPTLASLASPATLAGCSVVVGHGVAAPALQLLTPPPGEGVVVDLCHQCGVEPTVHDWSMGPLAGTALALPTGPSDFAATSGAEGPAAHSARHRAATAAPSHRRRHCRAGRGTKRAVREVGVSGWVSPPRPAQRPRPAPLTEVTFEHLRSGEQVAWIAAAPQQ